MERSYNGDLNFFPSPPPFSGAAANLHQPSKQDDPDFGVSRENMGRFIRCMMEKEGKVSGCASLHHYNPTFIFANTTSITWYYY